MMMPTHCPFCKGPLLSEYTGKNEQHMHKMCARTPWHNILFRANNPDHNTVLYFSTRIRVDLKAFWYPDEKRLLIDSPKLSENLPYFDPDLSNYRKLIDKLQTYLIFS